MPGIGYAIIAFAAPEHPRSDSASFVELADGRLFVAWMEFARPASTSTGSIARAG